MRIVLFALTGIGNDVLRALASINKKPILVITRKEEGPFPYYGIRQILDEANFLDVPVMYGEDGENEVLKLSPDMIIAATYHRLIPQTVIDSAKYAINLHPSILPTYPGKNPFYWMLFYGEKIGGVTAHRLTNKIDHGEIIMQKSIDIARNDTQGSLRKKIARLSGMIAKEIITQSFEPSNIQLESFNESRFLSCRQIFQSDRLLNLNSSNSEIERKVRALSPWPGALLMDSGYRVISVMRVKKRQPNKSLIRKFKFYKHNLIWCPVRDAEILLLIKSQ